MELEIVPATAQNAAELEELTVAPHQSGFIETVRQCLDEASRTPAWRPVGLYRDGVAVGFAMYGLWEAEGTNGRLWLDRLLIDRRYQGLGLGAQALRLLIGRLERAYGRREIYLSIHRGNDAAAALYERFGFRFNGETDPKGELLMVRGPSAG